MKMDFNLHHLYIPLMFAAALTLLPLSSRASDFNVPFVNGAELGNMYAGWAASANDASTTFTNPAGLVKIPCPQLVVGGVAVTGTTQFQGTATTPSGTFSATGNASSELNGFLPDIYFSMPVRNNVTVGFGINAPFALGTNFEDTSIVRYAATHSQIIALDFSPSVGVKLNDCLSVGLGLDVSRLSFALDHMYGVYTGASPDQATTNREIGWALGWHAGVLYQIMPTTRVGVSYNSQLTYHPSGTSSVFTPSAILATHQTSSATLPGRLQVSLMQDVGPCVTAMGSIFYTNWHTFQSVTLTNIILPNGGTMAQPISFHYRDTYDYALGLNYKANKQWLFRVGIEFLDSPSNSAYRSVVDPVSYATIVGMGVRYQPCHEFVYDLGFAHGFFSNSDIGSTSPIYTLSGFTKQYTNIFAGQLTWNLG